MKNRHSTITLLDGRQGAPSNDHRAVYLHHAYAHRSVCRTRSVASMVVRCGASTDTPTDMRYSSISRVVSVSIYMQLQEFLCVSTLGIPAAVPMMRCSGNCHLHFLHLHHVTHTSSCGERCHYVQMLLKGTDFALRSIVYNHQHPEHQTLILRYAICTSALTVSRGGVCGCCEELPFPSNSVPQHHYE